MFGFRGNRWLGTAKQATGVRPPGGWWTAFAVAVAAFVVAGPVSPHTAGASDGPQEVAAKRTQKSVTVRNPDGSFTTSLYAAPVNYSDRQGNWQPISSKIVPAQ